MYENIKKHDILKINIRYNLDIYHYIPIDINQRTLFALYKDFLLMER